MSVKEDGYETEVGNKMTDNWRISKFSLVPSNQNIAKTPCHRKQEILSAREDYRSQFYEHYRGEAWEYDREFMEVYFEDLNTTLIFVSFV